MKEFDPKSSVPKEQFGETEITEDKLTSEGSAKVTSKIKKTAAKKKATKSAVAFKKKSTSESIKKPSKSKKTKDPDEVKVKSKKKKEEAIKDVSHVSGKEKNLRPKRAKNLLKLLLKM